MARKKTRALAAAPVPVAARAVPEVGRLVAPRRQSATNTRGMTTVTPARVSSALRDLDMGRYELWADLCAQAKRDPVVRRAYTMRRASIAGREYTVEAPPDCAAELRPAAEQLAEITRRWLASIDAPQTFLMRVLDAVGLGVSAHELVWGRSDGLWLPQPAQIMTRELRYDDDWTPAVRDASYQWTRVVEHPGKFLIHVPWTEQGRPQDQGDFQSAIWYWLFKGKAWIAWLSGTERFGNPLILARMGANADTAQRDAILADLQQLTSDSVGVIGAESSIEVIQPAAGGTSTIYSAMRDALNQEIFIALGVSPDLLLSGANGSRSSTETRDGVRLESSKMDAALMWGSIVRDVCPWLSLYNLRRSDVPLPIISTVWDDSVPVARDTIDVGGATINDVRRGNGLPAWPAATGDVVASIATAAPAPVPGFAQEAPAAIPFPHAAHGLPTLTHTPTMPTSSASQTSPRRFARVPF